MACELNFRKCAKLEELHVAQSIWCVFRRRNQTIEAAPTDPTAGTSEHSAYIEIRGTSDKTHP